MTKPQRARTSPAQTGRPKKQPHELRAARLPAVRLTDAERIDLEAKAARAGVPLSEWIRHELLQAPLPRQSASRPVGDTASLITELNRIGVNVNQIARQINRGRDHDPHHLDAVMHELHTALQRITR
jgi:phosphate uptake regulator